MIRHTALGLMAAVILSACTAPSTVSYPGRGYAGVTTGDGPVRADTTAKVSSARGGSNLIGPQLRTAPPVAQADAFARDFLDSLQAQSFAERREWCGYFYLDASGTIAASPPIRGTLASCSQPAPPSIAFASYHTHGAFDLGYDNEVPSPEDLMSDFRFNLQGYVATPGGRVWRIDPVLQTAVLVCGPSCVAVDPQFLPIDEAGIRVSYSLPDLRARR